MPGSAVTYSTKLHQNVTASLPKAEFIQVTSAVKMAKYICMILKDLKIEQQGPTIIYEDNVAAIMMANASKLNRRTRYIDIS
eukprot:8125820-Ditylum_brightwellii.AAC.1